MDKNEGHSDHSPESLKTTKELDAAIIRFAGDSGDGMQLTGAQFTTTSAFFGNDISTLPDYPAEIRAPAGSLAGVSSFQINFSSRPIMTPGDDPHVLVAMNPAALKVHVKDLIRGGTIIVNEDAFSDRNLTKAGLADNPLTDGSLNAYKVLQIPISSMNLKALENLDLSVKDKERCKNFFALGLLYWMYNRPLEVSLDWIKRKFKKNPIVVEANSKSLKAGYFYGETTETIPIHYHVPKASVKPGVYRNITGNLAISWGLVAASQLAKKNMNYCTYPITPASDILHELSKHKNFGIKTIQCEDEIAAMGATIGTAFGGGIGITGTSGPGLALKLEAIGLAVITELPMVIINVQRGGPSTGLPTKVEQSDLLQAMYGRNGESPLVVLACSSPVNAFEMAIEAVRIAIRHMVPVILLSDAYVANSSEPWLIPHFKDLEPIKVSHPTEVLQKDFEPYRRDPDTFARPWAIPGTPHYEHRIGGLEKSNGSGNVSYDPLNHELMTKLREEKIAKVAQYIPNIEVDGEKEGDLLVIGWGGTKGAITTATGQLRNEGYRLSSLHIHYLNPFPNNLSEILKGFNKVVVAELNNGQLCQILRGKFLVDCIGLNKIQGKPFTVQEMKEGLVKHLSKKRKVAND